MMVAILKNRLTSSLFGCDHALNLAGEGMKNNTMGKRVFILCDTAAALDWSPNFSWRKAKIEYASM